MNSTPRPPDVSQGGAHKPIPNIITVKNGSLKNAFKHSDHSLDFEMLGKYGKKELSGDLQFHDRFPPSMHTYKSLHKNVVTLAKKESILTGDVCQQIAC
jgi:hypothetical protein